jgi:hypothetical protein
VLLFVAYYRVLACDHPIFFFLQWYYFLCDSHHDNIIIALIDDLSIIINHTLVS